jgi:hypothetical protein
MNFRSGAEWSLLQNAPVTLCVPALDPFVFWLTVNYIHQRKTLNAYEHATPMPGIVYRVMQFCHVLDQQTCLGLFPSDRCDPVGSVPPINRATDGQERPMGKSSVLQIFRVGGDILLASILFTHELHAFHH